MSKYTLTNRYDNVIDKLLREEPTLQHINDYGISFGILEKDAGKTVNGKTVFADCSKMPDKYKPFAPYDFLITIYMKSVEKFTDRQMEILLFHEMLHIGVDEIKNDEGLIMDWKLCINGHDLSDFKEIIDRFGTDWNKVDDGYEQITMAELEA